MSRIGRMPIAIPAGVTVSVAEGNVVTVKGSKGTLERTFVPELTIEVKDNEPHGTIVTFCLKGVDYEYPDR